MRKVDYVDERGYKRRTLIKDGDPDDMAYMGIPIGPPDLERIDWEAFKLELNNRLFQAGLFTHKDVVQNYKEFVGVLHVLKRYLVMLYQEDSK